MKLIHQSFFNPWVCCLFMFMHLLHLFVWMTFSSKLFLPNTRLCVGTAVFSRCRCNSPTLWLPWFPQIQHLSCPWLSGDLPFRMALLTKVASVWFAFVFPARQSLLDVQLPVHHWPLHYLCLLSFWSPTSHTLVCFLLSSCLLGSKPSIFLFSIPDSFSAAFRSSSLLFCNYIKSILKSSILLLCNPWHLFGASFYGYHQVSFNHGLPPIFHCSKI